MPFRYSNPGFLLGCIAIVGTSSCQRDSPDVAEELDTFTLIENSISLAIMNPRVGVPAVLANRSISIQIGRNGFGIPGKTVWWAQRDQIERHENPIAFELIFDNKPVQFVHSDNYKQVLDLNNSSITTSYNMPKESGVGEVEVRVALANNEGRGTIQLNILPVSDGMLEWKMPNSQAKVAFGGDKLTPTFDGRLRNRSNENITVRLKAGEKLKVKFFIQFGKLKALDRLQHQSDDINLSMKGESIEIDGPIEDQAAVNSFCHYLRTLIPTSGAPIGPMGLSSDLYNHRMFWDADIWMFPALSLLNPEVAKAIPDFRIAHAKKAETNFRRALSWARNAPKPADLAGIEALQYPWESESDGLEKSPTETKQQHHITGSVMFMLDQAAALGLADSLRVKAIGRKAANFYEWRATYPTGKVSKDGIAEIHETISPDEFKLANNDRYTNVLAEYVIRRWKPESVIKGFVRPEEDGIPLNYDDDPGRGYKQACGVLAIFPLQDPESEKVARKMMDLYAGKVTPNGPAMSDSVHALIWARLGEREKAYSTWRKSWQQYTNRPLMLFSEKKSSDRTYFCTGAAGCLQTVLYGFIGFRLDSKKQPGAAWSIPLKNGRVLSVKPNLPKAWNRVKLRFTVLGKKYVLEATHSAVHVTSGE